MNTKKNKDSDSNVTVEHPLTEGNPLSMKGKNCTSECKDVDIDTAWDKDSLRRFTELYRANLPRLSAYVFNLIPRRDAVDEILQESSIVMWRKFDELQRDSDFLKWAYVVTHYEVLAYRRKSARQKLVFDTELLDKLSQEYTADDSFVGDRTDAFKDCFSRLASRDQFALSEVYEMGKTIRQVAVSNGRTPGAYYKYLRRLRMNLLQCVKGKLGG